jgi:hypothetical protein
LPRPALLLLLPLLLSLPSPPPDVRLLSTSTRLVLLLLLLLLLPSLLLGPTAARGACAVQQTHGWWTQASAASQLLGMGSGCGGTSEADQHPFVVLSAAAATMQHARPMALLLLVVCPCRTKQGALAATTRVHMITKHSHNTVTAA